MSLDNLGALGIGIASLTVALTVVFLVLSQAETQIVSIEGFNESNSSEWTTSYNATRTLGTAVDDIPDWVPIIVIVVVGSVLLGLVALFRRR